MTDPAPAPASQYLHGVAPEEQRRLSRLNDLINQSALRELELRGGERVLDVGSGLGQFTRAMAKAAGPRGRVIGIERSAEQLERGLALAREAGEEGLAEFRRGDALALPLADTEWGAFDVAHARFLLEHVPEPQAVVDAMVRAVRPGGRVVLADDDHDLLRLWPEPPGVREVWRAYIRTYDRLGNDPFVGRRLVELLAAAGACPARNSQIFFGSCSGHPDFLPFVMNLHDILLGARETFATTGLASRENVDAALAAVRAWGERGDAAFWYTISWAEGVRPPG